MLKAQWPLANGLPQGLQWNGSVSLLLDGVSVEKLQQHLYQWADSPLFEPLYLGTRWAELSDISPCLVQINSPIDPVLAQFLNASFKEWGCLLFNDDSWDSLVAHWRWLITVSHPQGEEVLLRIADPAVIHVLLAHAQSIEDSTLFGPCQQIVTADAALGCWHVNSRPGDAPLSDHGKRYRLSDVQIQRLDEVRFRTAVMRLDQHLQEYFPTFQAHLGLAERWSYLNELALQAYTQGFASEYDITLYANIHGFLGVRALEQHPDLNALLKTPSAHTTTQRIEHIANLARERAESLHRNPL